jgi:hypothetical protein
MYTQGKAAWRETGDHSLSYFIPNSRSRGAFSVQPITASTHRSDLPAV